MDLNELKDYLDSIIKIVFKLSDEEAISILDKIYGCIKNIKNYRFKDPEYQEMIQKLIIIENVLLRKFIVESTPNYEIINREPNLSDTEDTLKYIAYLIRRKYTDKILPYVEQKEALDSENMFNQCWLSSSRVQSICENLGIECKTKKIVSCFSIDKNIDSLIRYHFFNIVYINGENYLLDFAYRQFFVLPRNSYTFLGIVDKPGMLPGKIMLIDEERKKVALKLLKDGFIKLDPDVFKHYMDGFAISFRNGLYYEDTKDFSYTADYTIFDYMNFLSGVDSQANYEDERHLGYQKEYLKNPNLDFSKK